jgi:glucose/arabinose dehydrogenase|tara:strand:+ start:1376 stop:2482 length:1107 start_codon:yes stop_codon:yes gene_type:complete
MHLIKFYLLISIGFLSICLKSDTVDFKYEILAEGLNRPWGVAIVDNDHVIFTELSGQLRQIYQGKLIEEAVKGVPSVLYKGQGGLSGVTVDPNFKENNILYLAFSSRDEGERTNTLKVIRAELINNSLKNIKEIFRAFPSRNTALHYGGKMTFLDDGTLLITSGDGFNYRESAQQLDNHFGKILRINTDGSIPNDNPFLDKSYALPEIWSYGHRNPQGLINHEGVIYGLEHGPMGGDEINIIEPGKNYGWPAITYGKDYNGSIISPFTEMDGMEQPIKYWVPSIAPSSITYYDKNLFSEWQNNLFVSYMKPGGIRRLVVEDFKIIKEEILFSDFSRIRSFKVFPDGSILLATDGNGGEIIRVTPNYEE